MASPDNIRRINDHRKAAGEPDANKPPLAGGMFGTANEVTDHLARARLPDAARRFLERLKRATFGDAGRHRDSGHEQPGTWCFFEIAAWADATGLDRKQVAHVRARLLLDRIIWWEPNPERPGSGRMGWNLTFAEWAPLSPAYRTHGGRRAGAGHHKVNQPSGVILNTDQPSDVILNTKMDSSLHHSPAKTVFKMTPHASLEPAAGAAPRDPLRMVTEEVKNRETNVSLDDARFAVATPHAEEPAHAVSPDAAHAAPGGDTVLSFASQNTDPDAAGDKLATTTRIGQPHTFTAESAGPTPPVAPPPPPNAIKATKPPKGKKPRRPPTPDEAYRLAALALLETIHQRKAPWGSRDREWKGAGELFKRAYTLEQVEGCYRAEMRRPTWDSKFLSLTALLGSMAAYIKSPATYRDGITRARQGAKGEYDRPSSGGRSGRHRAVGDRYIGDEHYWDDVIEANEARERDQAKARVGGRAYQREPPSYYHDDKPRGADTRQIPRDEPDELTGKSVQVDLVCEHLDHYLAWRAYDGTRYCPECQQRPAPLAEPATIPDVLPDTPDWAAMVPLIGYTPRTPDERAAGARVLAMVKAAGATLEEIAECHAAWRRRFPSVRFSIRGVIEHRSEIAADIAYRNDPNRPLDPWEGCRHADHARQWKVANGRYVCSECEREQSAECQCDVNDWRQKGKQLVCTGCGGRFPVNRRFIQLMHNPSMNADRAIARINDEVAAITTQLSATPQDVPTSEGGTA